MKIKLRDALTHLAVWGTYLLFAIIVYGIGYGAWAGTAYETTIALSISAGVFYVTSLYSLPQLLGRKRYVLFAITTCCVLTLSISLRFLMAFVVDPFLFNRAPSIEETPKYILCVRFAFQWFTFSLFATGYWHLYSKVEVVKELKQKELEQARQDLEYRVLAAQINPHFLFNTLNLFFSETLVLLPETAKSIGSLIEYLRASITKVDSDGMIPLVKEVGAIKSYIHLYERRFADIQLEKQIDVAYDGNYRIAPQTLFIFIENAFKHGSIHDEQKRLKIELRVANDKLELYVFNKKASRIKGESHGIGLKYIKKHLASGYNGNHKLDIIDNQDDYSVHLYIDNLN